MAVLSDQGLACSEPLCRQQDFLPFICEYCKNPYCVDHYMPTQHACPLQNMGDKRVYKCQECLGVLSMSDMEGEDAAANRHKPHCRPDLKEKRLQAEKGKRCPVPRCRERLTDITTYQCTKCRAQVCLKHRLPEAHPCAEFSAAYRKSRPSLKLLSGLRADTDKKRVPMNNNGSNNRGTYDKKESSGLCNIQ